MNCLRSSGAIVFRNNTPLNGPSRLEVLLVRYGQHHWGFPKGQMEAGETEEQTAIREVLEETGIEVVIRTGFRKMTQYVSRRGTLRQNVFFMAEPLDPGIEPTAQLSEVSDARWNDAHDVKSLVTFPGDYDLYLEALHDWKQQNS